MVLRPPCCTVTRRDCACTNTPLTLFDSRSSSAHWLLYPLHLDNLRQQLRAGIFVIVTSTLVVTTFVVYCPRHLSQAFLYILLDISFVQIVISNRYPQSHWARPTLLWGAPGYSQKCWAHPKIYVLGAPSRPQKHWAHPGINMLGAPNCKVIASIFSFDLIV